jgi:hypothetical protein
MIVGLMKATVVGQPSSFLAGNSSEFVETDKINQSIIQF